MLLAGGDLCRSFGCLLLKTKHILMLAEFTALPMEILQVYWDSSVLDPAPTLKCNKQEELVAR